MFFEDLESRQMYSVTLPAHTLVVADSKAKIPADIVMSAAPSATTAKKPTDSVLAKELQGAAEKFKDQSKLPGGGTMTLPGGLVLSLDPTHRLSSADLAGLNVLGQLFDQMRGNSELQSLLSQYGKSLTKMGDLTSGTDPSVKPALTSLMDSMLADFKADTDYARGDSRSQRADGNLGGDVTDQEIADAKAGKKKTTTTTDTKAPTAGEKVKEAAKEVGEAVVDLFVEVIVHLSKLPGADLIEGPKTLEKSHLSGQNLVDGTGATFYGKSGDKDPRMPHGELSDPNSDNVKLDPKAQKALQQLWAFVRGPKSSPTFADLGTTLISQPKRDGDGGVVHKTDRQQIKTGGKAPARDLSPVINTLGDDGTGSSGGAKVDLNKIKPGVKDPAKPGSLDTPTNPGGPKNGTTPTNPR